MILFNFTLVLIVYITKYHAEMIKFIFNLKNLAIWRILMVNCKIVNVWIHICFNSRASNLKSPIQKLLLDFYRF